MQKVYTRITDEEIAKIEATGKTVYQFMQEAIAEKLKNDEEKNKLESFEQRLVFRFNQFDKKLEEKIIKALEIHLAERQAVESKFDAMIERYEKSRAGASNIVTMVKDKLEKIEAHLGRR